ncbi:hypothetical protein F4823DRAFT_573735 [Ustulina deusta]|nr:hypothetical protein F4823DRAFT_573735 [Ustulina deusta]
MATRQTLTYDILLSMSPYLSVGALLNLATTSAALNEPLTKAAFRAALTIPFDDDLKPVTYAIKRGDIPLLSRTLDFLDHLHPQGWKWSQFYTKGVGRILTLAAAHNLKALEFLVQKYSLCPRSAQDVIPASILDHGFYSANTVHYDAALADTRNRELVQSAIQGGRYDCAAFLLKHYQPPLFPGGFALRGNPLYYTSAATLEFLMDHDANLGIDALHSAVVSGNSTDPRIFYILVQRGFGIDSPRHNFVNLPIGSITTPLYIACDHLQPASVESLLRLGANPNGVSSGSWIVKVHSMGGFQYFSPNPLLTLVFSSQWSLFPIDDTWILCRRFIECFQLLLRYGAIIPLPSSDFLEILLLKIWKAVCTPILRRSGYVLPNCADHPNDLNQGVRSLLCALDDVTLTPWVQVFQVVSETNPIWRGDAKHTNGKARLLKFFSDYQEVYGDLPGLAQLRRLCLWTLPDRYGAQLNIY